MYNSKTGFIKSRLFLCLSPLSSVQLLETFPIFKWGNQLRKKATGGKCDFNVISTHINKVYISLQRELSGNSTFSEERWVRKKVRQNDGCSFFATKMGKKFGKTQSPQYYSSRHKKRNLNKEKTNILQF